MTAHPELYAGFETRRITTTGAEIHARIGGDGPPLLMLHGYPQTHIMWHRVAPALRARFTLVMPDLRGYGASSCPPADDAHAAYGKRAMAQDMIEVMAGLGYERFGLAGHDRGARVAYRLALDHGGRVTRLALLDIATTYDAWEGFDAKAAMGKFHWTFLAQPAPLPETMIGADPDTWFNHLVAAWSGTGDLSPFSEEALAHYRAAFADPARIHASCEDYRAGLTVDWEMDRANHAAGHKISAPTLLLWGGGRSVGTVGDPLRSWRAWCTELSGQALDCGHFLAEERPEETAALLLDFFTSGEAP